MLTTQPVQERRRRKWRALASSKDKLYPDSNDRFLPVTRRMLEVPLKAEKRQTLEFKNSVLKHQSVDMGL